MKAAAFGCLDKMLPPLSCAAPDSAVMQRAQKLAELAL
jgi:hypothetical protein